MSDDRADRIAELLASRSDHSVESMMKMQYDVYSKHAEWSLPLIRPLLPRNPNGKLLRNGTSSTPPIASPRASSRTSTSSW